MCVFSSTYLHIPKPLESGNVGCEQCAHLGGVVDGLVNKVSAPEHTRAVDTILVHMHGVLDILHNGDNVRELLATGNSVCMCAPGAWLTV